MKFNPEKGKPNKETKKERKGFVKRAVLFLKEIVRIPEYINKRNLLLEYCCDNFSHFKALYQLFDEYEKNKLKEDKKFQDKLKSFVVHQIDSALDIPKEYIAFLDKEFIRERLRHKIMELVAEGYEIKRYSYLLDEKMIKFLKNDEEFQEKLKFGIMKRMEWGWSFPDLYVRLASKKTLQEALRTGIIEFFTKNKHKDEHIPSYSYYLDFADDETRKEITMYEIAKYIRNGWHVHKAQINYIGKEAFQKVLKLGNKQRIESGYSLKDSLPLMNEETKKRFLNELTPEAKRELTTDLITSFFNNSEKVRRTVEHLIKEKTNEEIEQILFDKTELAMGIKLHTEEGSPYGDFLKSTGGFHAHGQDTTWVANPLPNQKATELAFEVLEKLKEESGYEGDYGYIQTTFPKRLENEYASIATIVHLFTKDYFETKEGIDRLITHNQDTKGVTIYDAGRVITDRYTVPNEEGEVTVPSWEGRTDVLLSDTLNDVKNIRTVMTLLVHASEDHLAFSSLGKQFIQEVKDILNTSSHIDVNEITNTITFVGERVNPQQLGPFLSQIAAMREDLNQRYANYEKGRSYLNSLEEGTEDYEEAFHSLEKLYHDLISHSSYKLRELITSYREKMFSKGYFHELHGWKDEHERTKLKKVVGEQVERIKEDGIILN